jgi:hypothetical protein
VVPDLPHHVAQRNRREPIVFEAGDSADHFPMQSKIMQGQTVGGHIVERDHIVRSERNQRIGATLRQRDSEWQFAAAQGKRRGGFG